MLKDIQTLRTIIKTRTLPDISNRTIALTAVYLLVFNSLDLWTTYLALSVGDTEANIVAASLIRQNWIYAIAFKYALLGAIITLTYACMYIMKKYYPSKTKKMRWTCALALAVGTIIAIIVVINNLAVFWITVWHQSFFYG